MPEKMVIHPLNRDIRPVRLELEIEAGRVIKARAGTTYYWEFDRVLAGKDPLDALQLTQRSCGLDFVSHSAAAARALEEMALIELTEKAVLQRNILLALDIVYGHITHFYQNVLPDYVPISVEGPFYNIPGDYRISPATADTLRRNFWRSFDIRQALHRAGAAMGGKAPHICSIVFGGMSVSLDSAGILRVRSLLKEITSFVNNEYTADLGQVEATYSQYFNIGAGAGNFLSVGEFPRRTRAEYLIPPRAAAGSQVLNIDTKSISVDYTGSRLEPEGSDGQPLAVVFKPVPGKQGAYSWVKGAVYAEKAFETGALARMVLSGNPAVTGLGVRAVSVLGRYRARLEESKMLLEQVDEWLSKLNPEDKPAVKADLPEEGEAFGMAEASRGSVVHYVRIKNSKVHRYTVLDPLSWNFCPTTRGGQPGPVEQALLGVNVTGAGVPFDILRVARSL